MPNEIYPLAFEPVLRDYVWGGRRLESLYGRSLPPGIIAESWEISGHPESPTAVTAGYWQNVPLTQITRRLGRRLVGERGGWALQRGKFPLLVKLLDAHQNLSVQVHPDDTYASQHEHGELGKTEMWYVLHAEPGAELILGLEPHVTRAEFRAAVEAGRLQDILQRVPVQAGQAVAVPAGTVHALLAGVVVAEIQQNSDTTYRVYDWGRVGADGLPRPLHLEKALDVISFGAPLPRPAQPGVVAAGPGLRQLELVRSPYFVVEQVELAQGATFAGTCDGTSLEIWGCISGQVTVEWRGAPLALTAVGFGLLPATLGDFRVATSQSSTCLRAYLPPAA